MSDEVHDQITKEILALPQERQDLMLEIMRAVVDGKSLDSVKAKIVDVMRHDPENKDALLEFLTKHSG